MSAKWSADRRELSDPSPKLHPTRGVGGTPSDLAGGKMREDALALLDVIGLRPILVNDLGHDALVFLRYNLVLIDCDADMGAVLEDVLAAAAGALPR